MHFTFATLAMVVMAQLAFAQTPAPASRASWSLKTERTVDGAEADLVVRTGDINNLGFGWPPDFDPFSGNSRRVTNVYTRHWRTAAQIKGVIIQMLVDDFQAHAFKSHFQVSLNCTRIPTFETGINSLKQTGPIGKLVTLRLLPEYWPLLKTGTLNLFIDDPTTHIPDGYAIDFVRILVNPHSFPYLVSLNTTVVDAETHKPITGAAISAAIISGTSDASGKCALPGVPAGLVIAMASYPGYDDAAIPVDLIAGQAGEANVKLHHHSESTSDLAGTIARNGPPPSTAFTSISTISGHTDNKGADDYNL